MGFFVSGQLQSEKIGHGENGVFKKRFPEKSFSG
jgi:hypothetical protein